MNEHTQGPWEAVGNIVRTRRNADGTGGFEICECSLHQPLRQEDAKLIAEAPEMLEALEEINTKVGGLFAAMGHGLEISEQAWDEAFAALGKGRETARKARGEA